MATFVYRGSQRETTAYGLHFPLNVPVEVTEERAVGKLSNNPYFEMVGSGEKPPAPAPSPVADAAADEQAIRDRARSLGIARVGNKSITTLLSEIEAHGSGQDAN